MVTFSRKLNFEHAQPNFLLPSADLGTFSASGRKTDLIFELFGQFLGGICVFGKFLRLLKFGKFPLWLNRGKDY